MSSTLDLVLQLKTLNESDILNCCLTPTGQLVLHNTYSLERQPTLYEKAHLRAAFYWLKSYQNAHPSQLDQVRGYLEAAYHLEKLQAWDLIRQILGIYLENEGNLQSFPQLLEFLGLYQEQIVLYQPLLGKLNLELDFLCLNGLGYAHTHLCQFRLAVSYYERLLELARTHHYVESEIKALGGLGLCYGNWGQYQTAWNYCQQQLQVLERIDASDTLVLTAVERGRTLATMGYLAVHLRQFPRAIDYCQQALAIAYTVKDRQTQWYALGRLAVAQAQLGKRQAALATLEQQYEQRHQNPNTRQVSAVLVNLGLVYCYQRNFQAAVTCGQELLELNQQSGDISAQCYALLTLSFIHIWQDEIELAIEKTQQCLTLARQYHYRHHQSQSLSHLSYLHSAKGNVSQALEYGEQARAIAQNVSNLLFKGIALAVLGLAYLEAGEFFKSLRLIITSFIVLPPWRGGDSKLLLAIIVKRLLKYCSKLNFISS